MRLFGILRHKEQHVDEVITRARMRLDQLSRPVFDRQVVETLLIEVTSCRCHIEFLLSDNNELRSMVRALRDNLDDAESEIHRLTQLGPQPRAPDRVDEMIHKLFEL